MIKRLIFDVDGTLITNVNLADAVADALKEINVYSEEKVQIYLENMKTYEDVYDNYNIRDYLNHMEHALQVDLPLNFVDIYIEKLKTLVPYKNEELIHVISQLSKKYELVLLTNFFGESQLNRLNNMGIGKFFSECYGEELIKPNLNAYIHACGSHQPNECIMIGDNIYLDIEGAKKAGLYTIFVNSKNIQVDNIDTIVVEKVEDITEELIDNIDWNIVV